MKVQTRQYADPGTIFAPGVYDRSIGKRVPSRIGEQEAGTATLLEAEVSDDGTYVLLTLDVDETERPS
jgi:hypothetical protein